MDSNYVDGKRRLMSSCECKNFIEIFRVTTFRRVLAEKLIF